MQNSKLPIKTQNFLTLAILFLLPVYLIKIKFGWVSFNVLELLIVLLFFTWFSCKQKKYSILNTQYSIPLGLIFIGLLLSLFANKNYYVGFGVLKGWFLLPIIFAIILFDNLKKDESLLEKSWLALFLSGAAVSIIGGVYKLLGILTYDGRLRAFWDSPNQLAMFLAVPFLIGASRFNLEELADLSAKGKFEPWKRWMVIFGLALIIINLYLTKSYGAWLAISVALGVYFCLKYNKISQRRYLAVFLVILIFLLSWASFLKYKSVANLGSRSSLESRLMIWKSAGLMIKDNFLLGIGPGNFQNNYLEYQKYFPPYLEWAVPQPHNLFLAFWLEAGLLGLVGFIWLLILFFRDNKKTIANNREAGILLLAIMIYILLHGLVDTPYWRNDLAVVFWAMVGINRYLSDKDSS
jgi:O-antigen ligase